MTGGSAERAIENYARATGKPLSPHWNDELREIDLPDGSDALPVLLDALAWQPARSVEGRPRPDQFPLIVLDPIDGWSVVQQWDGDESMALVGKRSVLRYDPGQRFFTVELPDPLASNDGGRHFGFLASDKTPKAAFGHGGPRHSLC